MNGTHTLLALGSAALLSCGSAVTTTATLASSDQRLETRSACMTIGVTYHTKDLWKAWWRAYAKPNARGRGKVITLSLHQHDRDCGKTYRKTVIGTGDFAFTDKFHCGCARAWAIDPCTHKLVATPLNHDGLGTGGCS
jgi:hypothetical protein